MNRNLIAAFAAPAIAIIAVGVSAAVASGIGADDRAAHGAALKKLSAAQALSNARATFDRSDIDGNGTLDADEYAALAIVTAELSRLNGFVAFDIGDEAQTVALPIAAPTALAGGERARVEAVSRNEFYEIAGDDGVISRAEFAKDRAARFAQSDRNANGALTSLELVSFAAFEARLVSPEA